MLNDVNPERRCKIWIAKMITTCSHLFRVLRAENLFTRRSRLLQSKRGEWDALDAAFEKRLLKESPETDAKMLTESPEEIFLRFERPKTAWFELA